MSGTGPRFGSKLDRVGPTCWDRELAYFFALPIAAMMPAVIITSNGQKRVQKKKNARTGVEPCVAASVPIKTGIFTNGSKVSPGQPWILEPTKALSLCAYFLDDYILEGGRSI